MGSWKRNEVFVMWLEVDENGFTTTHGKSKPKNCDSISPRNIFSQDQYKTVAFIAGKTQRVCME